MIIKKIIKIIKIITNSVLKKKVQGSAHWILLLMMIFIMGFHLIFKMGNYLEKKIYYRQIIYQQKALKIEKNLILNYKIKPLLFKIMATSIDKFQEMPNEKYLINEINNNSIDIKDKNNSNHFQILNLHYINLKPLDITSDILEFKVAEIFMNISSVDIKIQWIFKDKIYTDIINLSDVVNFSSIINVH